MVVQKTIDNLKGRPQDERTAVAGGMASLVVVLLLIAWGILFFRRIQNGSQQVDLGGVQDQFNMQQVRDAQQQMQQQVQAQFGSTTQELIQIRDAAAARDAGSVQQQTVQTDDGSNSNGFYGGSGQ